MNLMNMAMKYVGPMVAERIAAKMGIGGPIVNKLIAAALPAIMGSLIGKSNSSGGMGAIMDLVSGSDRPQANGLMDMFDSGGDIDGMANAGGGMLEGLLGGQGLGALAGALGQHAGVEQSQAGSLLGMLAPVALGTIGDQVSEQNLDQSGLAQLLQGQAGNVAEAMPSGFASQLEGIDVFDNFNAINTGGLTSLAAAAGDAVSGAAGAAGDAVSDAAGAAGDAANAAMSAAGDAASSARDAAGAAASEVQEGAKKSMGFLPWLIGGLVVLALAWMLFGGGGEPEVDMSAAGQEFMVGDVDVGGEFSSITGTLTETFQGITDSASAEAAIPQLGELSGKITSLGESAEQLTGPAKTGFQTLVGTALGQLRPIIEGAVESSGAGAILQPIVDQILAALESMAG